MIIIIAYLSQAYDWSIDQMIMLEICHKSCYTTMEKNYKHHCIKNELNTKYWFWHVRHNNKINVYNL